MTNIVDPNWVEALKTHTKNPIVDPTAFPTILPDLPIVYTASDTGIKALWVVFVIMFISTLGFIGLAWRVPVQKRLFHVLTASITAIATLSYYAMATREGTTFAHSVHAIPHKALPDTYQDVFRQVFWARYVDWSLTTPLLLLDLAFLAGLSGANIAVAVLADLVMILTGLFAAFATKQSVSWGWYAMGCVAYLFIAYILVVGGRRAVATRGTATANLFTSIGGFTLILWTLYPIVWGIADGAKKWSVDTEIIAYAVLDVLAKPVFGFWLLFAHAKNATAVEGFWSHGLAGEGGVRLEDDEA